MARKNKDGLVVGVGVFTLAMLLLKRKDGIAWGEGWHWPVPDYKAPDGTIYPAVISNEIQGTAHPGLDVMYRRRTVTDQPDFAAGVVGPDGFRNGNTQFFAPAGTPILAARDARVWRVEKGPVGIMVVLDHGKPWASMYLHLQTTTLAPHAMGQRTDVPSGLTKTLAPFGGAAQTVKAGDVIGTMGGNPNTDPSKGVVDSSHLRHLHVEFWYNASKGPSQDPSAIINTWGRSVWQP